MKLFVQISLAAFTVLGQGCAVLQEKGAFPGSAISPARDLVVGTSTAKQVEAQMGAPEEKLVLADRDTVWFYPFGRDRLFTYAVRIAPDGIVRGVDQRLEEANVHKLEPKKQNQKQVRELIGPPAKSSRSALTGMTIWTYRLYDGSGAKMVLGLSFADNGMLQHYDYTRDPTESSGVL
jgi:hypothetical protein